MSSAKCISIHLVCKHFFTASLQREAYSTAYYQFYFFSFLSLWPLWFCCILWGHQTWHSSWWDHTTNFQNDIVFSVSFFFFFDFVAVCVFACCQSLSVGQGHSLSCPQWNSGLSSTVATQKCVWLIHQIASNVHYYAVVSKDFQLTVVSLQLIQVL